MQCKKTGMEVSKLELLRRLFLAASILIILCSHGVSTSFVSQIIQKAEAAGELQMKYIGIIVGIDDVSLLVFSLMAGSLLTVENTFSYFIGGAMAAGAANLLLAFTEKLEDKWAFLAACLVFRMLQGAGFAFGWAAAMTYMGECSSNQCSSKYDWGICGLVEVAVVVGVLSGPIVGNTMSHAYEYSTPFLLMSFLFFCTISVIALIEPNTLHFDFSVFAPEFKATFLFFISPSVQMATIQMLAASALAGFYQAVLSGFHEDVLKFETAEENMVWAVFALGCIIIIPLLLFFNSCKKYHLQPVAGFLLTLSAVLLYLPKHFVQFEGSIHYEMTCLFISGVAIMGSIIPTYSILALLAAERALENPGSVVAGCVNGIFALGAVIGPVIFGGVIFDAVGFRAAGGYHAIFAAVAAVITTVNLVRKNILSPGSSAEGERTNLVEK